MRLATEPLTTNLAIPAICSPTCAGIVIEVKPVKTRVKTEVSEIMTVEKPYNKTIRFLFELNHEKNRWESKAITANKSK